MEQKYVIEEYTTENGKAPFSDWVDNLKNNMAQMKLAKRIQRASLGNFGDHKSIKGVKGLYEMREHYGSGYRIFYSVKGRKIISLLLSGSTKQDQKREIAKAEEYLADYKRRTNNG